MEGSRWSSRWAMDIKLTRYSAGSTGAPAFGSLQATEAIDQSAVVTEAILNLKLALENVFARPFRCRVLGVKHTGTRSDKPPIV